MRVWIRRVAWVVAGVLLLWAVAWLGGPPLLKWQAQKQLTELLGRSVTVGEIDLRPWSLDLTVRDIAVGPAAGAAAGPPQLQVGRLHVDLSGASLWRGAPVVEALDLDAPVLRLARTAEGHYDIDDLLAKFATKTDAAPSSEPARFALYNLELRDGQLLFDDRPAGRQHRVQALHLALPFLSNLPAQVDVTVAPHLAFAFNGTAFDSGAQATPFAKNRSADLKLSMGELDLAPYKPYLPATLPVRLERGAVAADIAVQFAQPEGAAARLSVKGSASVRGIAVTDAAGAPLLAWDRLRVEVKDVQPLARQIALGKVTLEAPRVALARDAQGVLNLEKLGGAPAPANAPASAPQATTTAKPGWQIGVDAVEIAQGQASWNDAGTAPPAALQLDGIALKLGALRWPAPPAIPVDLAATLRPQGDGKAAAGSLAVKGEANDREAKLALQLDGLALDTLAPYLRQALVPQLAGTLSAAGDLRWAGGEQPRLDLKLAQATLAGLKLSDPKLGKAGELASLRELALKDVALDLEAHELSLGSVRLVQPSIALSRDKDGALNAQQWLVVAPAAKAPPPKSAPPGPAWRIQVRDFLLDGGQLRFADAVPRPDQPVRVDLAGLRLAVQNLALKGDKTTAAARVQLAAKLSAPPTGDRTVKPGAIDWKGQFALAPVQLKGTAKIERFPVHLFEPYFGERIGVGLLRADAGWQGDVSVAQHAGGFAVEAAGDVLVSDLNVHTRPASAGAATDELLTWQALNLKGLKFALPAQGRPSLEVAEAALSDFYSKLVITDQGRFNLQDVAAAPAPGASASAAEGAAASAPTPAASAASAPPTPDAPPPIGIRIGATRLTNGKIDFTDRFIRPNYSANLTDLNGRLGAFSNETRDMATLELRGKAAGTALLEITGALNPTAKPLALDIQAKATDLELAPLSPYAGKYAGYAIERGKLSMEVAYKIDPDGKLDAKNQVILNQLTFGDKVDSPEATKLPVLLAVALLKDRHGVIDINLPVSGSINDPKFSVGGIVVKVILNLLAKALTAPFSLLFGGGGGDEASLVEFKPGAPAIAAPGVQAIEKVAKALTDRPALKMTVTGSADLGSEREAYQTAVLEARLLAERRKEMLRDGGEPDAPVTMTAEERAKLLKEIYKASDVPNKPRNAIGMLKDLPAAEMEAMLKARTVVTEDAMRELALQRGLAVRDALIAKGLPGERLFLAAPKLRAAGEGDAAWTPRVQLALSTQ